MVGRQDPDSRQIRAFLRLGKIPQGVKLSEISQACDQFVRAETQKSLPQALEWAGKFVARARNKWPECLSIALRSQGWALRSSGKYRDAERAYLEARKAVLRSPDDRAKIDRILIDVYMYLGDLTEARRRARLAIQTFARLGDLQEQAKTRINYGNLYHRQDRHRDAQRQYELARQVLESSDGNRLVLGLCYYNLGNTQVQLVDFDAARNSYEHAKQRFSELGYDLYVNECNYGLAWLSMLEGDYHIALRMLGECEQAYRSADQAKGVMLCRLDRAEAYLGLNLFADAHEASKDAELAARRLGINYEMAKAAFFQARSAFALGEKRRAANALNRALAGFRKEGNRGFEAAVRLFAAQTATAKAATKADLNRIRRLFAKAQLPLWEAVSDLELLSHWPDDAVVSRRLDRNPAVKLVPHMFAQWQTQLGDYKQCLGKHRQAVDHWVRAAERLETVRAKLPPVEMRATFMRGRAEPYQRIIAHEADRHPGRAAMWVDRFKTVGVWATSRRLIEVSPERDEAEKSLAELAAQVSAVAARVDDTINTRGGAVATASAFRRMQNRVRDRLAVLEPKTTDCNARVDNLRSKLLALSHSQPVVQFYQQGDDFLAFIHRGGESRVHRYIGGTTRAKELFGIWQILVSRSMASGNRPCRSDLQEESVLFREYGSWLWEPLEISSQESQVLIIPDGTLSNVPWSAFQIDDRPLADSHRILLSPTIQHHIHASQIRPQKRRMGVFVGCSAGLSHTREELDSILKCEPNVEVHDPCARRDWPQTGDWKVWHYTGHARLRSDNPFYSSLTLADGPLFGADFRLKRCRVGLVTLAACRTAHHSVLAGEEATGLVRSLLEMGARNVIGSHWSVGDKSTSYWMTRFYGAVLNGTSVTESARQASLITREKYPSVYQWAPFSVFGAG